MLLATNAHPSLTFGLAFITGSRLMLILMNRAVRKELCRAVERRHGGVASFVQSVPVQISDGRSIWEGVVGVFDLDGNRYTRRAYAWSYRRDNRRRRFVAVLHFGPVKSPADAMRAGMFAEAA